MITVLHVITGLRQGGAENILARLAMTMDRTRFRAIVAPLRDDGYWAPALIEAGVTIAPLHFNTALDAPAALARLIALVRRERPAVVQTWLYHADLLGALAKLQMADAKLCWNLRNTDLAASRRMSWSLMVRGLAALSGAPDVVVSNAQSALDAHRRRGYRPRREIVIPNGVDLSRFYPTPERRAAARAGFGLPSDAFIIALPARDEGFKDHANFFRAAQIACARGFQGEFVLAGEGIDTANPRIAAMAKQAGLGARMHLLGAVTDMPAFYAAVDLVTLSSSHGEGFPNVLVEAMACGATVVATDVGDTRAIVGEVGYVVPPRTPDALADAWLREAAREPLERAARARRGVERVQAHYSLDAMVSRYEALYSELAGREGAARSSNR